MTNDIFKRSDRLRKKCDAIKRSAFGAAGELERKSFIWWQTEGSKVLDTVDFSLMQRNIDNFRYLQGSMEKASYNYRTIPATVKRARTDPTDKYVIGLFDKAYDCRRLIDRSKERFGESLYKKEFKSLDLLLELDEMEKGYPEQILQYFNKSYDILPEYRKEELGLS